jgi:hypothetical protein
MLHGRRAAFQGRKINTESKVLTGTVLMKIVLYQYRVLHSVLVVLLPVTE